MQGLIIFVLGKVPHGAPQEVEKWHFQWRDHTRPRISHFYIVLLSFCPLSPLHLLFLPLPFLHRVFHVQIRRARHLSRESREALL